MSGRENAEGRRRSPCFLVWPASHMQPQVGCLFRPECLAGLLETRSSFARRQARYSQVRENGPRMRTCRPVLGPQLGQRRGIQCERRIQPANA